MSLEKAEEKLTKFFEDDSDIVFTSEIKEDFYSDFTIIYVLTGGIEAIAKDIINKSKVKVLILALENDNALPASYELKAYFTTGKVEMLYISLSQMRQSVEKSRQDIDKHIDIITRSSVIYDSISQANFGIIGGISDWLINSLEQAFPSEFEIKPVEIRLTELMTIYRDTESEAVKPIIEKWSNKFNLVEIDKKELEKSARLYFALQQVIQKYSLTALTIKCFDLLPFKVTACLALAELNDQGIIAGCEGDTQALFTLFLAKLITNETPWMANISDINIKRNTIQLAHCTVPTSFLAKQKNISLDTHMESDLSLAISGELPLGKVTIIRIGKSLSQYSIMEGQVLTSNMGNKNICRTQAIIKIKGSNNWHQDIIGNHQIVLRGHHKKVLKDYLTYFSSAE
jgi:L-fucose isomerase-like protein